MSKGDAVIDDADSHAACVDIGRRVDVSRMEVPFINHTDREREAGDRRSCENDLVERRPNVPSLPVDLQLQPVDEELQKHPIEWFFFFAFLQPDFAFLQRVDERLQMRVLIVGHPYRDGNLGWVLVEPSVPHGLSEPIEAVQLGTPQIAAWGRRQPDIQRAPRIIWQCGRKLRVRTP